jgi:ATP-binding cassette subfamily B protein
VEAIVARPYLAQPLEESLLKHSDVVHAKVNPRSGRVLVLYNRSGPRLFAGRLIKNSLDEIVARGLPPARRSNERTALYRVLQSSMPNRREMAMPLLVSGLHFTVRFLEGLFIVSTIKIGGEKLLKGKRKQQSGEREENEQKQSKSLLYVAGMGALLNSLDAWLRYHRTRLWQRVGQQTQHNLRTQLIAGIEKQDLAFFDKQSTGNLMNLLNQDTQRIGEFVGRGGEQMVDNALVLVVYGAMMLFTSPMLTLMASVPVALLFLPPRILRNTISRHYARRDELNDKFSQMLENNLAGIVDVKSFTAEEQEICRFATSGQELAEANTDAAAISSLDSAIGRAIYSTGFAVTAAYGGQLVSEGQLNQPQYVRMVYMFPRILDALASMEQLTRLYHGAKNSAERILPALDSHPSIVSGPVRVTRGSVHGEVIFENVSFGYNPGIKVIDNVSFRLRPGEKLGIVGRTGSGKTTLLRLLMRFYEVSDGRILIDGQDIRELDLQDLRSAISLVSQDVYLFQGTVRDNVAYGKPEASESEVVDAMTEAEAKELLTSIPGGLDGEVGERGRKLSGGQKQRIAIARALLKDAPVLALDEVTSHLDYETEAAVKRSVREVTTQKSVITVAHRLAIVRDADKIIVLDRGRIREEGKHEELVGRGGIYSSLWQLQTGADSDFE